MSGSRTGARFARVDRGVLFHDAQMYNSERLVLELLKAAGAAGAVVANYAELEDVLPGQAPLATAVVSDAISGRVRIPMQG